jgi:hypothetical protein
MTFTKDDVATSELVDGKRVPLSDAERRARADEWNAYEAAGPRVFAPTHDEQIAALRKAVRGDLTDLDAVEARLR